MTERGYAYVELALIVHVVDGMFLVVNMEVGSRSLLFYFISVVLLPVCTTALPRYVSVLRKCVVDVFIFTLKCTI